MCAIVGGVLCDSPREVCAQPPRFLLSTSDVVGERTLDESSWRSRMLWRLAQRGNSVCLLSDLPMKLSALIAGSWVFAMVRDCTGEFRKKPYSKKSLLREYKGVADRWIDR